MPELPEVETLCRQLKPVILSEEILGMEILDSRLGAIDGLVGKRITSVARYGKGLEIRLDSGTSLFLHLRMTGRLQWESDQRDLPPHTRFVMIFSTGRLLCIDPRRFATLTLQDSRISKTSVNDPLRDRSFLQLGEIAETKKLPVKSFLMDQRIIAGIGNIYACEILHEASVNPWRQTCNVSRSEWEKIGTVTKDILNRAIACRGTTVSDWRDLFGKKGEYQHELKVYDREGLPCLRCHCSIQRLRLSGRGTYFCPTCQT
jgi:formamidopyrimidine-DNA glycosylase